MLENHQGIGLSAMLEKNQGTRFSVVLEKHQGTRFSALLEDHQGIGFSKHSVGGIIGFSTMLEVSLDAFLALGFQQIFDLPQTCNGEGNHSAQLLFSLPKELYPF